MKKISNGLVTALRDHLIEGNPMTQLESIALFGVLSLSREISRLRKEGWVINSKKVPYVKALMRVRKHTVFEPPENLPVKEIQLTEYWVSQ